MTVTSDIVMTLQKSKIIHGIHITLISYFANNIYAILAFKTFSKQICSYIDDAANKD